jgi:uncharacterized membrane-anchored protein YitT (DUF2179 family)
MGLRIWGVYEMMALNLESALAPIVAQVWYYFVVGGCVMGIGLGLYMVAKGLWGLVNK